VTGRLLLGAPILATKVVFGEKFSPAPDCLPIFACSRGVNVAIFRIRPDMAGNRLVQSLPELASYVDCDF
jgi:hypothetical protein